MWTSFLSIFAKTAVRLSVIFWAFTFVLVEISTVAQGRITSFPMHFINVPLFVLGVVLSLGSDALAQRLGARRTWLKWPIIALVLTGAGAIQTLADFAWLRTLAWYVFPTMRDWALSIEIRRISFVYIIYSWTLVTSHALIWSSRTNDVARLNEARAAAFETAATRAEAAALRLQLNPHFLFNTLNGIASLVVHRRNDEAEDMIGRLADFLRSSLAADPTALIPLRNELATINAYLQIEQARLGDRLRLVTAVDEATLDVPVPNFLLQPVIENAVKHGVAPYSRGGTIRLSAAKLDGSLILSVVDIQAGLTRRDREVERVAARRAGPGIGLANTRQRLRALYGDQAWVAANPRDDGYACEIGLPWPVAMPAAIAAE